MIISFFGSIFVQVMESQAGFGAKRISERVNKFVHGSPSEVKSQPDLWDFEICPEPWGF